MKNLARAILIFLLILFVNVSFGNFNQNKKKIQWLEGTWLIKNETADTNYSNHTGQITFFDGQISIDLGRFAAAGLVANSESSSCDPYLNPVNYKLLGNGYIYLTWQTRSGGTLYQNDAMIKIVKRRKRRITLIGQGGCGRLGTPKISYLTKIE